ncbi:MAG: hypothetical protein H8K09_10730 [Nitrospira sp.]|jgi:hypothetical protein|nr:hypothetical protein [Nitrospira sp.]
MKLWHYRDEYINADRIVRVKREQDVYMVYWLDEGNGVKEIVLRKDQWLIALQEMQDGVKAR